MKKIAIVVQRCHDTIVGGAESLAWQYANLLADIYVVDILTTTAADASYWANVLPEGKEVSGNIIIRRFHVDVGYSPYRSSLFARLINDVKTHRASRYSGPPGSRRLPWAIPLQEELIRHIGPYSESLISFLRQEWANYKTIIFVTYLYPTSYFGLLEVPQGFSLFAPTLHDEEPAYLSAYKHAAGRAGSIIWLSEGERRLGHALWGELAGQTVGMYIDTGLRTPLDVPKPYLLYCGRIDPNKGCRELFEFFSRFKESYPSDLRLVLTGKDDIAIPERPDIEFRGFVSNEEKFRLMAGASIYLMPSGKESFSIVTLEAMAQGVPVLASGACEVIVDHITSSGGGRVYDDYESFAYAVNTICRDPIGSTEVGKRGREYVLSNFNRDTVKNALVLAIESCAATFVKRSSPVVGTEVSKTADKVPLAYVEPRSLDISYTRALPLPPGISEEQLHDLLTSIQVEDAPVDELNRYAHQDFRRFVYTLGLVPDKPGNSVLELGANPYFTTTLLYRFRDSKIHLANFFGPDHHEGTQRVLIRQTGEVVDYAYKHFNAELHVFPYENESFDAVLFCEIIEHLLLDPVHALVEIRRVLKPTGVLILTTPNVARLENLRKMARGENIYDPYSGYGPYGRHNREYTQQELFLLLSANGFRVDVLFTADVDPALPTVFDASDKLAPLIRTRHPELGQYIFCRCSLIGEAENMRPVRPDWLYRSVDQQVNQANA